MAGPLGRRALGFIRALPDHRLLDRAVRGRTWILLLGVMLAGIVAMQVEVLKLGAGIGRSIQTETALQSRNELLRASVAALADDGRIERIAARMGMVMPAPSTVGFLSIKALSPGQAAANIHGPDAAGFLARLAASAALTRSTPGGGATAAAGATGAAVVPATGSAAATAGPSQTSAPVAAGATAGSSQTPVPATVSTPATGTAPSGAATTGTPATGTPATGPPTTGTATAATPSASAPTTGGAGMSGG